MYPDRLDMRRPSSELRRRQIRRAQLQARRAAPRGPRKTRRPPPFPPYVPRLLIELRGELDLVEHAEATRVQLAQFEKAIAIARQSSPLGVLVRMTEVTGLDACALAYLFALHDVLRAIPGIAISGRYPRHAAARQALADAGFDEHFASRRFRVRRRPSLKLRLGSANASFSVEEWRPLLRFLGSQPGVTQQDRDALYHAFGECVENVLQHAYEDDSEGRWYALAIKPTGEKPARAVIMDLGVGIPNTIRRDVAEEIRRKSAWVYAAWLKLVQDLLGLENDDAALEAGRRLAYDDWLCIFLASQGLRTQSADAKRGTGLNWLRHEVQHGEHRALHLLSGKAAVTWRGQRQPEPQHLPGIMGTIVCLEIGSPKREWAR